MARVIVGEAANELKIGSLWRSKMGDYYMLGIVRDPADDTRRLYVAINLADGHYWEDLMGSAEDAVCGLTPFFGSLKLSM